MLELTAERVIALSPNTVYWEVLTAHSSPFYSWIKDRPNFWRLRIKLLYTFENRFLCEHKFHFSGMNAQGYNYWVVW